MALNTAFDATNVPTVKNTITPTNVKTIDFSNNTAKSTPYFETIGETIVPAIGPAFVNADRAPAHETLKPPIFSTLASANKTTNISAFPPTI